MGLGDKVLFLARNYPPAFGGMEKMNYDLVNSLEEKINLEVFSNKHGRFSIKFQLESLLKIIKTDANIVFFSDPFLSPLIPFAKLLGKKTVIKVHGLDIIHSNRIYQMVIPKLTFTADKIISISQATQEECLKRGADKRKCLVIPVGINPDEYYIKDKKNLKEKAERLTGIKLRGKKIVLSVGRLYKRKGFEWFVDNVMPRLVKNDNKMIYVIISDGPERKNIKESIARNKLNDKVFLLGKVSEEIKRIFYNICDVFVLPNIKVEGDMEGFGIVALEATSCGLPVVASDVEGIRDAIQYRKNGFMVDVFDIDGFMNIIVKLLKNDNERKKVGRRARRFSLENCGWEKIAQIYINEFKKFIEW